MFDQIELLEILLADTVALIECEKIKAAAVLKRTANPLDLALEEQAQINQIIAKRKQAWEDWNTLNQERLKNEP